MIRDFERKNRGGRTKRSRQNLSNEFFEFEDIVGKRFVDNRVQIKC